MFDNEFDPSTPNFKTKAAQKIAELFPNAVADGKINFDVLKEMIDGDVEDISNDEQYEFTWRGKKAAKRLADTPTSKTTLIGNKKKSRNWNKTNNIFIEGDNLEVLKLLQRAYAEKIKMIYLDPPYNTGKDFVYRDSFHDSYENYLKITGQIDEDGHSTTTNKESSGRFHTDWLNMMYPRLKLARNLLTDDGIIMISINDQEVANLKELLNELFGETNFIAQLIWNTDGNIDNQSRIKVNHEYILMYAKNNQKYHSAAVIAPEIPKNSKLFNNTIANTIVKNGPKNPLSTVLLPIGFPTTGDVVNLKGVDWPKFNRNKVKVVNKKISEPLEATSGWSSVLLLKKFINNNYNSVKDKKGLDTTFALTETGAIYVYKKRKNQSHVLSIIRDVNNVQTQSAILAKLGITFSYPKPVELLEYLIKISNVESTDTVLDIFSGSASSAEAVMRLNAEKKSNIKYIMVQLPELTPEDSDASKNGFKTITNIAEERIRRTGDTIVKRFNYDLDVGFKTFELSESTIKSWNEDASQFNYQIEALKDPFIDGSTNEQRALEIALKLGIDLTVNPDVVNGIYHFVSKDKEVFIVLENYDVNLMSQLNSVRKLKRAIVVVKELNDGSEMKFNLIELLKQNTDLNNHFTLEWI